MPDPVEYPYEVVFGIITSPGKFEGQCSYMPEMYERWLEGMAMELPNGLVSVAIEPQDREKYPELADLVSGRRNMYKRRVVKFIVDDQGFVREQ